MKYGEARQLVKESLTLENGVWKTIDMPEHDNRMSKKEAAEYYTRKLEKVWRSLGYKTPKSLKEEIKTLKEKIREKDAQIMRKDRFIKIIGGHHV